MRNEILDNTVTTFRFSLTAICAADSYGMVLHARHYALDAQNSKIMKFS